MVRQNTFSIYSMVVLLSWRLLISQEIKEYALTSLLETSESPLIFLSYKIIEFERI